MASATDYTEEYLLKHSLGIASLTAPAGTYLAVHTADPGETGANNEASGGSYARVAITWTWNSGSARAENSAQVNVTGLPSGTYTHFSIKDAASGGNTLYKGAFGSSQSIVSPQTLVVAAGDLRVSAD